MYDDLIRSLRCCVDNPCYDCKFRGIYMDSCDDALKTEAADAIEKLQRDNAALNETVSNLIQQIAELSKPRWFPVNGQLIHSGWYFVACNEWGGSVVRKAVYDEATKKWFEFPCGGPKDITKFVTHWMPLPDEPKEG